MLMYLYMFVFVLLQLFFLILTIMFTNLGVALFQSVSFSFSDYWRGLLTVTGYMTGHYRYKEFEEQVPYWGAAFIVLLTLGGSAVLTSLVSGTGGDDCHRAVTGWVYVLFELHKAIHVCYQY